MDIGLLQSHIVCSCYRTHISHKTLNKNKIYACHCETCLRDNKNNRIFTNKNCPLVWVNISDYKVSNEFNNSGEKYNEADNILWMNKGLFCKRGYCKYCNDALLVRYFYDKKYICNFNAIPNADLFCKSKNRQVTYQNFNSLTHLFFHNLFNGFST